jgi:hypothetical protein
MMNRVLICGDRWWARHEPADLYDTSYKKRNLIERNLVCATLTGLYNEHMVGFGSAHLDPFVLISGLAKGADDCADWWAHNSPMHSPPGKEMIGYDAIEFFYHGVKANWEKYGKAAGPIRNQEMLEFGKPNLVLAFHNDIANSKGTKHMVSIAEKAGIATFVVGSP